MKNENYSAKAITLGMVKLMLSTAFTAFILFVFLCVTGYVSNNCPERYCGIFQMKEGEPQRGYTVRPATEMFNGEAFDWENGIVVTSNSYTGARYFTLSNEDKSDIRVFIYIPSIKEGSIVIDGKQVTIKDHVCERELKLAKKRTELKVIELS